MALKVPTIQETIGQIRKLFKLAIKEKNYSAALRAQEAIVKILVNHAKQPSQLPTFDITKISDKELDHLIYSLKHLMSDKK